MRWLGCDAVRASCSRSGDEGALGSAVSREATARRRLPRRRACYSTLNFTDCRTFPSCTTSQRQSPDASSPSILELCVRQGEPPTLSFTRACSASPLYHTCSISLSAAPLTLLRQISFAVPSGNDSAAPVMAWSATAVPTETSALAAYFAAPASVGPCARAVDANPSAA